MLLASCGEGAESEYPKYDLIYRFDPYACYHDGGIEYVTFSYDTLCVRTVCFNRFYIDNCNREPFLQ